MAPQVVFCLLVFGLIAYPAVAGAGQHEQHFDAKTGYRIAHYRAPVHKDVPGAKRIWIDELENVMAKRQPILVDVMAAEGAGPDPKTGAWRLSKTREHIPGSHWLPDVGKGKLTPSLSHYFRSNLERLTGGDKTRAIVIYCQADCWMGWNATRRVVGWGYTDVYWYEDGTDGWRDDDGAFAPATPIPVESQTNISTEDK